MGLYDVSMFMSFYGFGIGMMFANFHVCGMLLVFTDMLYMLTDEISKSKRSDIFKVTDVNFIRPCGFVDFALFY